MEKQQLFEYESLGTGIMLTRFLGGPTEVEIPREIDGKEVTVIGPECFRENGLMVTEIVVPDTVKELKNDAFAYTVMLERLVLPETLEVIGADFLGSSGLLEAYIPAGVHTFDRPELTDRAFNVSPDNKKYFTDGFGLYERNESGVELVAIDISKPVERYNIDESATGISLNALRDALRIGILGIPKNLTDIKEGSLSYNGRVVKDDKGVKSVLVAEGNPKFIVCSDALCEVIDDKTLKIIRYFGSATAVIPENVSVIGFESFKNTPVDRLEIGENVKEIKENAFSGCPIKEIVICGNYMTFGDEDRFTMESVLEQFGKNGKIYDFTMIDEFLLKEYLTDGRVRMITARLLQPYELSEESKEKLFDKILTSLYEVIDLLAEKNDLDTVEKMGKLGFFTEDNIDSLIDKVSGENRKELTAWFMAYKNENVSMKGGFDFSL